MFYFEDRHKMAIIVVKISHGVNILLFKKQKKYFLEVTCFFCKRNLLFAFFYLCAKL